MRRFHAHLRVDDLQSSVRFYSMLFGTEPTDPLTFSGMVVLLIAVAFAAGYIPAWRASRINPMTALRSN